MNCHKKLKKRSKKWKNAPKVLCDGVVCHTGPGNAQHHNLLSPSRATISPTPMSLVLESQSVESKGGGKIQVPSTSFLGTVKILLLLFVPSPLIMDWNDSSAQTPHD